MFWFLIPLGVDYKARRLPMVTFSLMGICLVLYLISLFIWMGGNEESMDQFYVNFWFIPDLHRPHTYLTSMFVHADIWHFVGNMVYLFLFGSCVEDFIGRVRYVLFYILAGLASVFLYLMVTPSEGGFVPMGGASGAISGCMGAFILLLPKSSLNMHYFYFIFFRVGAGEFQMPSWIALSLWFGMDVLGLILTLDHIGGGVAFAAHVGGFIFGMMAMLVFKKLGWADGDAAEETEIAEGVSTPIRVKPRIRSREGVESPVPAPDIYLYYNNVESGPFRTDQIEQMLALGSIDESAQFWREGMPAWEPIEALRPS